MHLEQEHLVGDVLLGFFFLLICRLVFDLLGLGWRWRGRRRSAGAGARAGARARG